MIYFQCDYAEGCHPALLEALTRTNFEQSPGYGEDSHCATARTLIAQKCQLPQADVHLLVGGTQTNTTVISALLRPWQGVIAADSGHIALHETGAIEATGHKVLTIPGEDGRLSAQAVEDFCQEYFSCGITEHMVEPGMVYLSQPTEEGTLYTLAQLRALRAVCDRFHLPLFVDGARLGYGLSAPACDMTLPQLAALCDVFYLGGTKCGALFGEAVVVTAPKYNLGFRNMMKQNGGLLAKGRLLGVQFETLFADNLYFEICGRAVTQALAIRDAFLAKGIPMLVDSPTNQQFPILTGTQRIALEEKYVFEPWAAAGENHVMRVCTSWATRDEDVAALLADISAL